MYKTFIFLESSLVCELWIAATKWHINKKNPQSCKEDLLPIHINCGLAHYWGAKRLARAKVLVTITIISKSKILLDNKKSDLIVGT